MPITVTDVEKSYTNVATNNNITVPMPLDSESELAVTYGSTRLPAIINTDYTITLNVVDQSDFVFKPLASLLTKIGVAGMGNVVYLLRAVPYTSDLSEGDSFFRTALVKAVDRIMMRLQQIAAYIKTGANHNITISTAAPSGGVDGDIWLRVP